MFDAKHLDCFGASLPKRVAGNKRQRDSDRWKIALPAARPRALDRIRLSMISLYPGSSTVQARIRQHSLSFVSFVWAPSYQYRLLPQSHGPP